jgi:hypothetical protein
MSDRRRLAGGLALLGLAGILAWGGTVDPTRVWARWPAVVVLGGFGIMLLFSDGIRWLRERERIEGAYLQMIMLGIAIGGVAWLIPSSGSRTLLAVAALLVVVPLGLWIRARLRARDDDTHRPG